MGMKTKVEIKVPKKNPYKRVAKGNIDRSLAIMKKNERDILKRWGMY